MAASTRPTPRSPRSAARSNARGRSVRRLLTAFLVGLLALFAVIGALAAKFPESAGWTPKLGLDLAGGTQVILKPVATSGKTIDAAALDEAVQVMRKRVDGSGVSEAEVSTQGDQNIVVSMPAGTPQSVVDSLAKSSMMRFRPVLAAQSSVDVPQPTSPATPGATATGTPAPGSGQYLQTPGASAPASAPASKAPTATGTSSAAKAPVGAGELARDTATPSATPTASTPVGQPAATGTPGAVPGGTISASPTARATPTDLPTDLFAPQKTGKDPSDPAWITPAIQQQFAALNCLDPKLTLQLNDDPRVPLVTCAAGRPDKDGTMGPRLEKYILGPAELDGNDIYDASSGLQATQTGAVGTEYEVQLKVNADKFANISKRLVTLQDPRNRFGMVLDGEVISAPVMRSVITNGDSSITGGFTQASAENLAQQLKFGALPMSFQILTKDQVSPQLGADQLSKGLLAGAIGLLLVVLYSLVQYRALGLVTVASLVLAGALTYGMVTFLGWAQNYRLSMAGITGLILSIGMTADSFIVYFERVRDEIREGRSIPAAVEIGWKRARGTVLIADAVNILAAVVLYLLASSNVRGFAYTLGLTTLIDVVIVFCFTHPVVSLLSRTRFFGDGHPMSGFDPKALGAHQSRYLGRGRFRNPEAEIASTEDSTPRPSYTQEGGAVL